MESNNTATNNRTLLQEQMKKLDLIQDKLLAIDQDKPQYDIIEALYLELGRALKDISDLKSMQEQLERYQEEKKEQQEQLERYQEEKDHLLSLLKYRDFENSQLHDDITRLSNWLKKINKHFLAITASRRWKLGNGLIDFAYTITFKKKSNASLDHIMMQFSQYNYWLKSNQSLIKPDQQAQQYGPNVAMLSGWLDILNKKLPHIFNSKRMRIGNRLIAILGAPLGKGKSPIQVCNINKILLEYQNWYGHDSYRDSEQLSKWLTKLERNYRSLLESKRWKIGNAIVNIANLLTFQKKRFDSLDSIEAVFSEFHHWQRNNN